MLLCNLHKKSTSSESTRIEQNVDWLYTVGELQNAQYNETKFNRHFPIVCKLRGLHVYKETLYYQHSTRVHIYTQAYIYTHTYTHTHTPVSTTLITIHWVFLFELEHLHTAHTELPPGELRPLTGLPTHLELLRDRQQLLNYRGGYRRKW